MLWKITDFLPPVITKYDNLSIKHILLNVNFYPEIWLKFYLLDKS